IPVPGYDVSPMRHPERSCLLLFLLLAAPALAHAAGLEETLNARWRGAFVVVRVPVASDCDGYYNDNDVVGNRADSKARRRFEAGELAHVERIGVRRGRVDVFLDIAEGVLREFEDGPFTLYEPETCKIQLRVPVPDRADAAGVELRLGDLLELHETARAAEASPTWNRRQREPFPEEYDRTLAAYESYKVVRTNAAIQERMDDAIEEASRITDQLRSDPEYLDGFAAGVDEVRERYYGDCGSLLTSSFSPDTRSGKSSDWKRGYEDGQRLSYNLEILRKLKGCFVPVPPVPE
ncbi:MAG TPA: hypothetical protein VL025_03455, partial [Thermoanaerobaculia bacterium]|nr:hypothetical protein [Thermoanaerobaculia bacterium]